MLIRKLSLFTLVLVLAASVGTVAATGPSQSQHTGIFGTVLALSGDHPRAVAGETDITLDTAKGPVEITATPSTQVRIAGLEKAEVADIPVGSEVAVLASNGQILNILVKPDQPEKTRHFAGIVTNVDEDGTVSIRDAAGLEISAVSLPEVGDLRSGDMVTAVLEQDMVSGVLLVTGLDRATDSLARIQLALERAQKSNASPTLAVLRHRLSENSARHLTLLQNLAHSIGPSLRPEFETRLSSAQVDYGRSMSQFGAGPPTAQISGIITSIDEGRKRVTVQPANLPPVELVIDGDTIINFRGNEISFRQLDLANRIQARYDLETHSAKTVMVGSGQVLKAATARTLLATKDRGEIIGQVIDLDLTGGDPRRITIQDSASGQPVTVLALADSVILSGGTVAELNKEFLDTQVTAIFDQDSLELIELDVLATGAKQRHISGVVYSFFSKVLPGNMLVQTQEGEVRAFTRTDETVIRRDGRHVSINEVRLGDLVRANTRIGAAAPDTLEFLSLKSPRPTSIRGAIRGIVTTGQGGVRITVTTSKLDMVTVLVDTGTQLIQQGKAIDIDALTVGQRVLNGSYDPISQRAARLTLQAERTARLSGEITALDENRKTITVASKKGELVTLDLSKAKLIAISPSGEQELEFGDLKTGDRAKVAFYNPATNQVWNFVRG